MKIQTTILGLLIFFTSLVIKAQDCTLYFDFVEGTTWEMTSYDKKGKQEGKIKNTIIEKSNSSKGNQAKIKMEMLDVKEKDKVESEYTITCDNGNLNMSMDMFMSPEMTKQMEMQGMENIEVNMEMGDMEFPKDLSVGMELKPCEMTMTAKMNGIQVMSMQSEIKDRKVLSKESITTEAGTFECFKIEQTTFVKMGFAKSESKSITYLSEGVGVVKTEDFDKKGNLVGYTEITKIN